MATALPSLSPRPPVIAVMGHIDHGKSTLLDYIRRSNTAEKEVGGITQRLSAYEVIRKTVDGTDRSITFLDTPGHEAFGKIRERGAHVADIAILVVSAEDGVKPQTLDALKAIKQAQVPYIVAINKIDKPNANIERTKISLSENEVFVEGFGGDVTAMPISAKTGAGIEELLDMILLTTDVLDLTGDHQAPFEGIIIEASSLPQIGTSATIIIKNGSLKVGDTIVTTDSFAPVRYIENYLGKKVAQATFSSPVRITGWSIMPETGEKVSQVASRKLAEVYVATNKKESVTQTETKASTVIPLIVKADAQGALDAIFHELQKINNETIAYKVVQSGVGEIRESDIKTAASKEGTVIIGFSVGVDKQADIMCERLSIKAKTFDIIYELSDYLKETLVARTPKILVEELSGSLKVLKFFSKTKSLQVIGGRVESGTIVKDALVKVLRRDHEIGTGHIRELQAQKIKTGSVSEGNECGLLVEAKIEIAPGDILASYISVEK